MTVGDYVELRKEAFERLRKEAPERPVTMSALLGEIANLLREQSRAKGNE